MISASASRSPVVLGMPGYFFDALAGGMPILYAVSRIFCGPLSMESDMSTKAVLIDSSIALMPLTRP
ncbi:MAG: hypothetical protein R2731_08240 [Nocardioides sp.]